MKKIFGLFLAAVLAVGLCVPAAANEVGTLFGAGKTMPPLASLRFWGAVGAPFSMRQNNPPESRHLSMQLDNSAALQTLGELLGKMELGTKEGTHPGGVNPATSYEGTWELWLEFKSGAKYSVYGEESSISVYDFAANETTSYACDVRQSFPLRDFLAEQSLHGMGMVTLRLLRASGTATSGTATSGTDISGAPLKNALVTLKGDGTEPPRSAVADELGFAEFGNPNTQEYLEEGSYEVEVTTKIAGLWQTDSLRLKLTPENTRDTLLLTLFGETLRPPAESGAKVVLRVVNGNGLPQMGVDIAFAPAGADALAPDAAALSGFGSTNDAGFFYLPLPEWKAIPAGVYEVLLSSGEREIQLQVRLGGDTPIWERRLVWNITMPDTSKPNPSTSSQPTEKGQNSV